MDGPNLPPLDECDRMALQGTYLNAIRRWWGLLPRPGREMHPTDPDGRRRRLAWWRVEEVRSSVLRLRSEPACHRPTEDGAATRRRIRVDPPHHPTDPNPRPGRWLTVTRL